MSKEGTQQKIGKLLDGTEQRDAIHIAVVPVQAGNDIPPGAHIGFRENGKADWIDIECIGIADPFIFRDDLFEADGSKRMIHKGRWFYLFLYPNTVTGLRHVYEHPALPNEDSPRQFTKEQARKRLEEIAHDATDSPGAASVEELIETAIRWIGEDYMMFQDIDAHGSYVPPDLWEMIEIYTGKKLPSGRRPTYYSCSC